MSRKSATHSSQRSSTGRASDTPITGNTVYLTEEAKEKLDMGDWAWRNARRQGLPVAKVGNHTYVLGDDLLKFFEERRNAGQVKSAN